jgi:hypothetical protein
MASKKTNTAESDSISLLDMDPETRLEAQEMAELDRAEGGALFKAIEESKSVQGAEVILRRTMPADAAGFCDKIPVGEFDLSMLKTKYGPGTYVIRFSGIGGKFLPGGGTIKIAPIPNDSHKGNGATDITSVMELMEKQRANDRERNSRLLELAIPTLGTVLAALLGGRQQTDVAALVAALKPAPGPTLNDLAQTLASMKSLTADNSPRDPLETIFNIMEKVKGLSGSGEQGESNWTDVVRDLVKEAIPAVKPMLDNMANNQAEMHRRLAQQPPLSIQPILPSVSAIGGNGASLVAPILATDTPSATAVTNNNGQEGDMWMILAREHLGKILKWANDDRNPQAYAEVFMDELPQIVASYIKPADALGYLQRSDWWEQVIAIYPNLKPHREWCDEFRQELISFITEQVEEQKQQNSESEIPEQITDTYEDDTK